MNGPVVKLKTRPMTGAEPLMCTRNVEKRIRACGGAAVYGWQVKRLPLYTHYAQHCVWRDDSGELWDVTPQFEEVYGEYAVVGWPDETEFVVDDVPFTRGESRYAPA